VEGQKDTYTSPFIGIEYRFLNRVNIVFAYGVDPLDFAIDYDGRHVGRWKFRQEYMWNNENATIFDSEQALQDQKVITLRATFSF
jgi:hypothetical protein